MYQTDLLVGRTILITGGGTGFGRAMALRMAGLGAKVGILGRTVSNLELVVGEIRAAGGTAAFAGADIRDAHQVAAAFDSIEAELGPIDSLINNAAGNFLAPSEDLSANAFDAVVRIVLHGTFHCTLELGRRRIAAKGKGAVLNITTTYAFTGSPFVLPSACGKAGVEVMTKSLAVEWAEYGIRLNCIAPGPIPTEGAFSRLMAPGLEAEALKRIPAKRFGKIEELANLAVYLMSDQAEWITGETVVLDGGEWLQSGQEFARPLVDWDRGSVKQMLGAMKPPRK